MSYDGGKEGILIITIFIILTLILLGLVLFQLSYFGIDNIVLEVLTLNLISNIVIIMATVFIVDKLLRNQSEKQERDSYFETIGSRHILFTSKLESLVIHYVTREPTKTKFDTKEMVINLEELILNIDSYINKDFLTKKYNVLIHQPPSFSNFIEKKYRYDDFMDYFKKEMLNEITKYTSRYISVIPNDLLQTILKVEDLLLTNHAFINPLEKGIRLELHMVEFDPQFIRDAVEELISLVMDIKYYTKD